MIIDIIVVVTILLCIFLGYKRGLIKVGVRILSFIAAIIIALILYTPISNYIINNTEIVSILERTIEGTIYHKEEKENKEAGNLAETMQNYVENYTEGIKENTSNFIAHELALTVVKVGTWIGLFAITKLLLIFLKMFTNIIEQIPIIKQFNKVRRYNIWNIRRICYSICCTCNTKNDISYDRRKCNVYLHRKLTYY